MVSIPFVQVHYRRLLLLKFEKITFCSVKNIKLRERSNTNPIKITIKSPIIIADVFVIAWRIAKSFRVTVELGVNWIVKCNIKYKCFIEKKRKKCQKSVAFNYKNFYTKKFHKDILHFVYRKRNNEYYFLFVLFSVYSGLIFLFFAFLPCIYTKLLDMMAF